MLEKNKDYIEFKAAYGVADYRQYETTKLEIAGYVNADLATPLPNPGTDYILISKDKFDRLQAKVSFSEELAKQWEENYSLLLKKIGFDTVEELVNYLDSEAECDTLHEDILKLHDEVKYANDKWANTVLKLEECEKDYRLKRDKSTLLEQEIKIYTKALKDWKEVTGCPSPFAVKDVIESGASWHHAYNESKKVNKKFADSIKAWQNVTGYSTPEDYLAAVIKNTAQAVLSWQKATGCSTPEEAKDYWVAKLSESGESNESLAREVRSWHEITGFSTPKNCSSYIDTLEKKLEDIKDLIEED